MGGIVLVVEKWCLIYFDIMILVKFEGKFIIFV